MSAEVIPFPTRSSVQFDDADRRLIASLLELCDGPRSLSQIEALITDMRRSSKPRR